jgi:dienelactone hydrolase
VEQIVRDGLPVAVVGIASGGITLERGEDGGPRDYCPQDDPRARAYLQRVDPPYFRAHLDYVIDSVLRRADRELGKALPRITFGMSNGGSWAAAAAAVCPGEFAAVIAFSMGSAPEGAELPRHPHALAAGKREPPFLQTTCAYAEALRRGGAAVRLRTPARGHEYRMWVEEFAPALGWVLDQLALS